MFHMILSISHKEHLIAQLELMQQQAHRQLEYYQSMNEKILQMKKIRHDFNNQLQTAYGIFLRNTEESRKNAFEFLDQMQNHIDNEKFFSYYCSNMIVNVILDEKVRKAKEQGLVFETEITLPEELPIDMVDICSIFSNLLDNAIDSASLYANSNFSSKGIALSNTNEPFESLSSYERGKISVLSYLRSGYFVVKVTNSFQEDLSHSKKDPDLHGYGLSILKSIAQKYHGDFTTIAGNGVFTATIKLNIDSPPKTPRS